MHLMSIARPPVVASLAALLLIVGLASAPLAARGADRRPEDVVHLGVADEEAAKEFLCWYTVARRKPSA